MSESNEKLLSLASEMEETQKQKQSNSIDPLLITNEDGSIKKLRINLVTMIKTDSASKNIQFNEFTHEMEMRKEPINDKFINKKLLEVERNFRMKFSKDDMLIALEEVAHQQKYHPVKEMIELKPWDNVARAETLFIDYIGAEDNDYTRGIAKKWLTGAIKRIYEPACKFEIVPVLQGAQGLGKSTLAHKLGGIYFTDSLKGLGKNKDDYQQLLGSWIVELGELSSMRSTETDIMKNFISAGSDKVRLPYERLTQNLKRTVAFIGTTNPNQYLTDLTGNRRFFPIHSKQKPLQSVFELKEATVQQIWAEAFLFYKEGVKPYVDLTDPTDIIIDNIANEYREEATEYSTAMTDIQDFLNMDVPSDWHNLMTWEKRNYFIDYQEGKVDGVEKNSKTSVKEILNVVMRIENSDRSEQSTSKKIKLFMDHLENWEHKRSIKFTSKKVSTGYQRK